MKPVLKPIPKPPKKIKIDYGKCISNQTWNDEPCFIDARDETGYCGLHDPLRKRCGRCKRRFTREWQKVLCKSCRKVDFRVVKARREFRLKYGTFFHKKNGLTRRQFYSFYYNTTMQRREWNLFFNSEYDELVYKYPYVVDSYMNPGNTKVAYQEWKAEGNQGVKNYEG